MPKAYTLQETKELMKRVLVEYVKCGVIGTACDYAGVRRKTHTEWMHKYDVYRERFEELKEKFVDGIEVVGMEKARNGSDSMIQFMLKAHRREIYGDKSQVELAGSLKSNPITLVFQEGMLNEDEKKLLGGGSDGDSEVDAVQSSQETSKL